MLLRRHRPQGRQGLQRHRPKATRRSVAAHTPGGPRPAWGDCEDRTGEGSTAGLSCPKGKPRGVPHPPSPSSSPPPPRRGCIYNYLNSAVGEQRRCASNMQCSPPTINMIADNHARVCSGGSVGKTVECELFILFYTQPTDTYRVRVVAPGSIYTLPIFGPYLSMVCCMMKSLVALSGFLQIASSTP